jgi:PAP2 superfamily protein
LSRKDLPVCLNCLIAGRWAQGLEISSRADSRSLRTILTMRGPHSGTQPLRGFKKATAFGAVGVAAMAVAYWLLGADWAFVAAMVLACSLAGQNELLPLAAVGFYAAAYPVLALVTRETPHTLDAALWGLETRMGYSPSALAMATVLSSGVLVALSSFAYRLGLLAAWVFAAASGKNPWRFAAKLVAAGLAALPVYWLLPACGPRFFLYGPSDAPRNAMPSMHMVWALMVRGRVGPRSLGPRVAADVFIILTVLATLGLGEHYVVDLLAAVPFWMAFEAVWRWRRIRIHAGLHSASASPDSGEQL